MVQSGHFVRWTLDRHVTVLRGAETDSTISMRGGVRVCALKLVQHGGRRRNSFTRKGQFGTLLISFIYRRII